MCRVVAVPDRQKMSNGEVWGGSLPPHASLYPAYPSTGVHIIIITSRQRKQQSPHEFMMKV